MASEVYQVICEIVSLLEKHRIDYLIGGSLSSSVHGIFRATNDVDILLERALLENDALLHDAHERFIVDKKALVEHHAQGRSYNIFHEPTAFKVDLFPAVNEFHRQELKRSIVIHPSSSPCAFKVATAEDMILAKLQWFKKSASERQWQDLEGMVRITERFDHEYLEKWSEVLGLHALLRKLFSAAATY
ncbi:MAG: hypothetical protein J5J00_00875 [Deltaproteobacteria bacterium]|nr:hypothetical protein [Deltaproteobacteria bacterium]